MKAPVLSFADISTFNKAVSDPLRIEVLRVLAQDSYGVLELCEIFDYKQSGMSHHLKVLAEAGLVAKRREGNSIFYSRALVFGSHRLAVLQQQLYITIDSIAIDESISVRLQAVSSERTRASQVFFAQQADNFKAQQDLIAEYPVYGNAVTELLHNSDISNPNLAVEIGPGAGEFLPVLATLFDSVIAVDNSTVMLQRSSQYCDEQGIDNVSFVHSDTSYFAQAGALADCMVINMVLHHTSSPADIFVDMASGLRSGGVLLVTDLCRHDQDWAKTACGDVWLGFDPSELQRWALSAGLQQGQSNYLALRNGFQIQLQQFKKT